MRAAIKKASKGYLIAWDPVTAREAWRVEHKGAWNGGTLATAGGHRVPRHLDGRFLALDARTGRELWSAVHPASTLAGPVTYSVNGEQYVAVLSGYGSVYVLTSSLLSPIEPSRLNGRVHVYRIGGTATPPPVRHRAITPMPAATRHQGLSDQDVAPRRGALRSLLLDVPRRCRGRWSGRRPPTLVEVARRSCMAAGDSPAESRPSGCRALPATYSDEEAEWIRAYVAKQAAAFTPAEQSGAKRGTGH